MTLLKHQIDAQDRMELMEAKYGGGFLCDGMGMGKTVTMSYFMITNKISHHPSLVVCPLSVIGTWEKWLKQIGGSDFNVFVYHGPQRKNELKKQKRVNFVITTYHSLGTGELADMNWGRMVLDESHTIRNLFSKNPSKQAKGAILTGKKAVTKWCITGTPFLNRVSDIAAQCHFVGTKPFNSLDWWKNASENKRKCWVQKHMIRRDKDMFLKPPQYSEIYVNPTGSERKRTALLCEKTNKQLAEYKRKTQVGESTTDIQHVIAKLIVKLRIASNSYLCNKEFFTVQKSMKKNAKVKAIVQQVIDLQHVDGIVIFSQFTMFLDLLEDVLKHYVPHREIFRYDGRMSKTKRDTSVEEFNYSPMKRVMLISLHSGGVGLSLHHNASHVLMCEPYFNSAIEKQAEERVHRIGQTEQVHIYRFYANRSIDLWMKNMKNSKNIEAKTLTMNTEQISDSKVISLSGDIIKMYES